MSAVIHIGANKAASTTLQRYLFSKHPALHYVGEDAIGYSHYKKIITSFLWTDDLFWDREEAERFFKAHTLAASSKTFVFSSEDIMTSHIPSQCARRLKFLIGDATILLIVRNQIDALASYYANHGAFLRPAPRSHYKSYVPLSAWLEYNVDINEYGPVHGFQYIKFINMFTDVFGAENIAVAVYEDLLMKPERFYGCLSSVLDISSAEVAFMLAGAHARRRQTWRMHYFRRLQALAGRNSSFDPEATGLGSILDGFLKGGRSVSFELPPVWRARLELLYAPGNRELAKRLGLPLAEYRYPL